MTAGTYTGTRIADYRLERLRGRGSFGEVYEAKDLRSGRKVAVKLLLNKEISREEYQSFWKEARTLANLSGHPNIVRVFAFNFEEELPYMVMEFAPGGSLLDRHPFSLARVVSYTRQVAGALQFAHDANIVHHDVKPANLLVGARGQILLSDFGVAEANHSTRRARSEKHQDGTPAYMPPEKITQGFSRRAGDQYSLAVMVYQWLSGRLPFRTIDEALHAQPPSLRSLARVSPAVASVVERGMARNPDARYARVEDFALALQRAAAGKASSPVRDASLVLLWAALLTAISLLLGGPGGMLLPVNGTPGLTTINGLHGLALLLLFFGVLPLAPQYLGKLLGAWRGAAAAGLYLLALTMAGRLLWPVLLPTALMWRDILVFSPLIPAALASGWLYTRVRKNGEKPGCGFAGLVSFVIAAGFWFLVVLLAHGLPIAATDVITALVCALPVGLIGGVLDMLLFHALLVKKSGRIWYPAKITTIAGSILLCLCLLGAGFFFFPRISSGSSGYLAVDLQVLAGSNALVSSLDNAGTQHLDYISANGDVHELSGQPGGEWRNRDLTAVSKGTPAQLSSALSAYQGSDGSEYIDVLGSDRHIHELFSRTGGSWQDRDLTDLSGGSTPMAGSALSGYMGPDHSEHINYLSLDRHIHELYLFAGQGWVDNDLTMLSRGVVALPGSGLCGYMGDNSVHVNFVGPQRHVHELYWFNGWRDNDLTALSGGVAALSGSALSGYWGGDGSVHVHFIGSDRHVHELYWLNRWSDNDLTALSGGVAPSPGSALTGSWSSTYTESVSYMDTSRHIYEIYR